MLTPLLRRALHRFDRHVFGNAPTCATDLPAAEATLGDAPVPTAWIREGQPRASATLMTCSRDGGLRTGLWECTPGKFRWYFECDEVIVVLSGRGRVRIGPDVHELVPGKSVFFPVGTDSEWEISETLRKHFTHRFPSPWVRRLLWD